MTYTVTCVTKFFPDIFVCDRSRYLREMKKLSSGELLVLVIGALCEYLTIGYLTF
jgi:hypothetical protein